MKSLRAGVGFAGRAVAVGRSWCLLPFLLMIAIL